MPTPTPYPNNINALKVTVEPVIDKKLGLEIYQSELAVGIKEDKITIQVKKHRHLSNVVTIEISIPLNDSGIINKDYEVLQNELDADDPAISNTYLNKAFFGFKDVSADSYFPEEIDTKQMPSLIVTPLEKPLSTASNNYYDPPSLLLRPSIEDNDANVNVSLSGTIASRIIKVTDPIEYHSLLVSVAPPRLGDYVIDGLINADSFHISTDAKGNILYISFDLANTTIVDYSQSVQTPEGVMKVKPDTMQIACLKLQKDNDNYFIEAAPPVNDECVYSNFSFLILDSLIIGDAGKLTGGSGKLTGGSGKLTGGSGKLTGGSGVVLGGSGKILGGSGKILGASGKLTGGSSEIFTAG